MSRYNKLAILEPSEFSDAWVFVLGLPELRMFGFKFMLVSNSANIVSYTRNHQLKVSREYTERPT